MLLDRLHRAMEMRAGLYVNREIVCSGLCEFGDKAIGVRDHEVDVEGQLSDFSERRYDRRTDGQIWDEMSVHDINMEEVGSRPFHGCHFLGQSSKVSS